METIAENTEKTKDQKLFELSYMLSPQIKDEEVSAYADKIKSIISQDKGAINKEQIPQKRKLAYPIGNQRQGYFGFVHFYFAPKHIEDMRKKLFLDTNILRHLVIGVNKKQIAQMQKPVQNIAAQEKAKKMMDKAVIEKQIFKKEDAVSSSEEQKVELEELDKKLEEILK